MNVIHLNMLRKAAALKREDQKVLAKSWWDKFYVPHDERARKVKRYLKRMSENDIRENAITIASCAVLDKTIESGMEHENLVDMICEMGWRGLQLHYAIYHHPKVAAETYRKKREHMQSKGIFHYVDFLDEDGNLDRAAWDAAHEEYEANQQAG